MVKLPLRTTWTKVFMIVKRSMARRRTRYAFAKLHLDTPPFSLQAAVFSLALPTTRGERIVLCDAALRNAYGR
jgi:hypothetical protein